MIVREATQDDLGALREQYEALLDETTEDYLRVPWEHRVRRLEASIAAGLTLVADADGVVIAFVEGSKTTGRLGWIRNVYVVPDARRNGIARALIEALGRRFASEGVTHIGLKVGSSNEVAARAYARLGFEEFARTLAVDVERLLPEG